MTDKKKKKTELNEKTFVKYLENLVKIYSTFLGLNSYSILIDSEKKIYPIEKTAFKIDVNYPYKRATIYWTDRSFKTYNNKNFELIKGAIIHELCHIPIEQFKRVSIKRYTSKDEIQEAMEHSIDHFAIAFFKLIEKK